VNASFLLLQFVVITFKSKFNFLYYTDRFDVGSASTLCLCTERYAPYPINGTCLLSPTRPGDTCLPPYLPCTDVPEAFQCSTTEDGFCKCDDPSTFTDFLSRSCLPLPHFPEDACHSTMGPCDAVPFTDCVDGKCLCDKGLVFDEVYRRCIEIPSKIGDPCHPIKATCNLIQHSECR
jgi:hypothetical protein